MFTWFTKNKKGDATEIEGINIMKQFSDTSDHLVDLENLLKREV